MKKFAFLLVASLISSSSFAQMAASTKKVCNQRCVSNNPVIADKVKHEEKLKQIQGKKSVEADPVKIKELEKLEEAEVERYDFKLEKFCSEMCKHNPED